MTPRWLALVLLAGCSSAVVSPPETPSFTPESSLSKPGSFEPYLFGGERLTGQVVILGVPAAEATVAIDGGCQATSGPITIVTSARATGLFALLAHSWLTMDTVLSPSLGLPDSGHT